MAFQDLIKLVQRLNAQTEVLTSIGALLRADAEGIEIDPELRRRLEDVVAAAAPGLLADLDDSQTATAATVVRGFFLQAADLLEDPGRPLAWNFTEPAVLQSLGAASAVIADAMARIVGSLDGLSGRLGAEHARILDVGSGVGGLTMALCRVFPEATVVGCDPYGPSMQMARHKVAASPYAARIELRECAVEDLGDVAPFDAVWLPGPFLPPEVLAAAAKSARDLLVPGGWVLLGLFAGPEEPLAEALAQIRVLRSGGKPMNADEAESVLTSSGLDDVHTIPRDGPEPVRFVAGRRGADGWT